jgi:TRAP-type uncharacterized transport system substrate-binding protein
MNTQFFSDNKWTTLIGTIVLVGGMALAYKYARPAVPKVVVMSTGSAGGAYESFAKRYALALAEEGITLTLRPSKGATENLSRLLDEDSGVDLALVQNGLIDREKAEETSLESLGSFFYEPALVFYRPQSFTKPVQSLGDLLGKRIAVGPEGSGTRVLATSLLALHDIKAGGASTLLDVGGESAAAALREGKIDVALFVGNANAPLIQSLFRDAGLGVADLDYAETYARRLSQVTAVNLPAGVIDVAAGLPAQSVRTVATTSSLVARDDLHPAVTFLLMRAAKRMHGGAGPIAKVNEFPTFAYSQDFLPSADAERLMKEGTPFLYRYLPFKFANFISRGIVFLIPLLALLISLSDWIPKIIAMRAKNKLFKHYKEMKAIDEAIRSANTSDELNAAATQLDALDAAVGRLKIPVAHSNDQFGVRDHMDLVRVRIERKREALRSVNG